jgi:3-phosphoshikimate 1-carboxyvinyltransferase
MVPQSLPDLLEVAPRGPLDAKIRVPGSRSETNRALPAAALARGRSRLVGAGESDDTEAMRGCLRALGVSIEADPDGWPGEGRGGRLHAPAGPLDARSSGTTARFMTALATLADGPVVVDGAPYMRRRPIAPLCEALAQLGAGSRILGDAGCPPVELSGGGLPGGRAQIDARDSSQFVSGILLASPAAAGDVELVFEGGVLASRAFVELTVDVMRAFGARVELGESGAHVRAGHAYEARTYRIEPDAQSAVYGFAAAAIAGGRVRVEGIPARSSQTDLAVLEVLEAMGCRVERLPDAVEVSRAPEAELRGVDVDMNHIPDAALAIAVVALFAEGRTRLRNIAHIRIKETDRMAALETEIRRIGGEARAGRDDLVVAPGVLHGADVETYDDHRMAMSFALAGLRVPGIRIRDPGCVAKTWPGFFETLAGI